MMVLCLSARYNWVKFVWKYQRKRWLQAGLRCFSQINTNTWTADDMVNYINDKNVNKIVVMAGAGISTPSGIPDFRSPGTGLYHQLEKYNLPYAEAIFDIEYFYSNPKPFFTLAKELYPGNYNPNVVHYFCRLLSDKNKLLRMYTQNIDGLETLAGIPSAKLVEAHGSFATATCIICRKNYDGFTIKERILNGEIPYCETSWCKGIIKPDIVFFGEQLPHSFIYHVIDTSLADLLIIMGTSLEVFPFAGIADMIDENIPRLLINNKLVGTFLENGKKKDVALIGDLVEEVKKLIDKLGWSEEMNSLLTATRNG